MKLPVTVMVAVMMLLVVGYGVASRTPNPPKTAGSTAGSSEILERANSAAALASRGGNVSCRGGESDGGSQYDCGSVTCYVTPDRTSPDGKGISDYYDCIWQEEQNSVTGWSEWTCVVDTDGVMTVKSSGSTAPCVP
jgi:hypothetical protein